MLVKLILAVAAVAGGLGIAAVAHSEHTDSVHFNGTLVYQELVSTDITPVNWPYCFNEYPGQFDSNAVDAFNSWEFMIPNGNPNFDWIGCGEWAVGQIRVHAVNDAGFFGLSYMCQGVPATSVGCARVYTYTEADGHQAVHFTDIWIRADVMQNQSELLQTQLIAHEIGHALSLSDHYHLNPTTCYKTLTGVDSIMDASGCHAQPGPTGHDLSSSDFEGTYIAKAVASASLQNLGGTTRIQWNGGNVNNEKAFDVLREINGGGWHAAAYVPKNNYFYDDSAPPPGSTYCYYVRSSNSLYPFFHTPWVFAGCRAG